MASYYYSNCSSLSAGCYLYTNQALTSPVSDGYYSDGTNCFTVTGGSGYVSNVETCATSVYITITTYAPEQMTCYSNYTFAAAADNVVDTIVYTETTWYGDLGGSVTAYINIAAATSCNSTSVYTAGSINCFGEFFSYGSIILSPSSYGIQIYQAGTVDTSGFYPC